MDLSAELLRNDHVRSISRTREAPAKRALVAKHCTAPR